MVLIKVHAPTAAMKARFCRLPADLARSVAFAGARFHIQLYVADERRIPANPLGCAPLVNASSSVLTKSDLKRLWPAADVVAIHARRKHLSGVAEVAFFAKHRPPGVDFLWVLEQDVSWTGNLFDALATFSDWGADLLCQRPHIVRVKRPGGWTHQYQHSSWLSNTLGSPRHICGMFVARYSSNLLRTLSDEYLAKGRWAHVEMFAPAACALEPTCKVEDYHVAATEGLFGQPFTCCLEEQGPPGKRASTNQLFHPAKQ